MKTKRQLGQFFTTNTKYILQGFEPYILGKDVIDAFAGAGDLLNWAKLNGAKSIKGYDIDAQYIDNKLVLKNDSLLNPLKYDFVITNPPYLYQNKLEDNSILLNSKHTDLYQLSLEKIMDSREGIVIVPINFLSAENSKYIRSCFLNKFEIVKCNYFTERVFEDTTYNVISFYYKQKVRNMDKISIDFTIYPRNKNIKIDLFRSFNWQIGGEFLNEIKQYSNPLNITRLEEEDLSPGKLPVKAAYNHLDLAKEFKVDKNTWNKIKRNIVILKAIDTGTDDGKICLDDIRKYGYDALVSIKTSRNQINLVFRR
ncbi:MAG: Eco57I restriction-modification methylase domain-containing protein [Endomicrobium sp.]|jgi:predicted RNA methylase|nr:Eco57I restriction-modification methylase domain-containing protein [Endomicrobium sp.]